MNRALASAVAFIFVLACGGEAYRHAAAQPAAASQAAPSEAAPNAPVEDWNRWQAPSLAGGTVAPPVNPKVVDYPEEPASMARGAAMAQAEVDGPAPPSRPEVRTRGNPTRSTDTGSTDTVEGVQAKKTPLLIYTADLTLAVFEVAKSQDAIVAIMKDLNGYLASQQNHQIVVRIPAGHFEVAIRRIEETGDVLHRNIQVSDVTEQFRDVEIRIRNAEAMRARMEALLERAGRIEDALRIEHELQRLTEQIELLKGRLRVLAERIAFSTITVRFQAVTVKEDIEADRFRLPFEWLDELGLSHLLRL